jgi:hypothetical protein
MGQFGIKGEQMETSHKKNSKVLEVLVTDDNFNEMDYLTSNPDVAQAVSEARIGSGKIHFEMYGRNDGRKMRITLDKTPQLYSWIIKVLFTGMRKIVPQSLKNEIKRYTAKQLSSLDLARHQTIQAQVKDVAILLQQVLSILHQESNIPLPPQASPGKSSRGLCPRFYRKWIYEHLPNFEPSVKTDW